VACRPVAPGARDARSHHGRHAHGGAVRVGSPVAGWAFHLHDEQHSGKGNATGNIVTVETHRDAGAPTRGR
jgi:hypothetical protein